MKVNQLIAPVVMAQAIPMVVALGQGEWKVLIYLGVTVVGGWVLGLLAAFWIYERR